MSSAPSLAPSSSAAGGGGASQQTAPLKKKRNNPGTPYPDSEVIALSPKTLMATNRFVCEVCNKGFQREQNLQLHRRSHNLPWKLKQKNPKDPVRRRVYVCPEPTCAHHDPLRALGDLTGIKKHFSRKHGEKKWKCDKCYKKYAVQSDWRAHSKVCGTREYRCDCGTLFSRRDSFITHRAFCDALAQESTRTPTSFNPMGGYLYGNNNVGLGLSHLNPQFPSMQDQSQQSTADILSLRGAGVPFYSNDGTSSQEFADETKFHQSSLHGLMQLNTPSSAFNPSDHLLIHDQYGERSGHLMANILNMGSGIPQMSATALLQKAAQMGSSTSSGGGFGNGSSMLRGYGISSSDGLMHASFNSSFGSGDGGGGDGESLRCQMENETNLQGIMNSMSNEGSGVFDGGAGRWQEMGFAGYGKGKLDQNQTRDFLGVESMVGRLGEGGDLDLQRAPRHYGINLDLTSENEMKSTPSRRPFAG